MKNMTKQMERHGFHADASIHCRIHIQVLAMCSLDFPGWVVCPIQECDNIAKTPDRVQEMFVSNGLEHLAFPKPGDSGYYPLEGDAFGEPV